MSIQKRIILFHLNPHLDNNYVERNLKFCNTAFILYFNWLLSGGVLYKSKSSVLQKYEFSNKYIIRYSTSATFESNM